MLSPKNFGSVTDVAAFWTYWDTLKNRISEIIGLGPKIYNMQTDYESLARRADRAGAGDIADEARSGAYRSSSMYDIWASIKAKLDEWLPNWMKAAGEATVESGVSGFGFFFVLPAWAIAMLIAGGLAAIAYVVTNWQNVSAQYNYERDVLQAVKDKVISAEEAAKIISPVEEAGVGGGISVILEKAGTVGTIALVLLGGMFIYNLVGRK